MSIDIHKTIRGDVIEFDTPNAGHDWQKEDVLKRLSVNQRYTVDRIVVENWSTSVYLVGYDKPFNSVFFNNIGIFS